MKKDDDRFAWQEGSVEIVGSGEEKPVTNPTNRLKAVTKSPDAVASVLRQLTQGIEAGTVDRGKITAAINGLSQYGAPDIKAGAKAAGMTLVETSKKKLLEELERKFSQRIGTQERTQFRSVKGRKK